MRARQSSWYRLFGILVTGIALSNIPRLTFVEKSAYGVGQAAEGLKNGAFGVFLFFYYVQVLGLSGTHAGLAVGTALIVDAVTDPLAGSISDNWRSPLGRRHPFMYAAVVPMALCFYLVFSPPPLGQAGLFVWLLTFAVLTRVAMTLYHVPHIALGAELSVDFEERTTVVAFRHFFSTFGALLAYAIGFGLFFRGIGDLPHGQFQADGIQPVRTLPRRANGRFRIGISTGHAEARPAATAAGRTAGACVCPRQCAPHVH